MVEELLDDTKLISVPKELANQLRLMAGRLGVSVTSITTEAIEQVLRADLLGSNVKEAVDHLQMSQVHRGAGLINFQRTSFKDLVKKTYEENPDSLRELWYNSGRWYAAYLSNRINGDLFKFFKQDLLISWNLDESEITVKDVQVDVRLTSFGMSTELTDLIVMYTKGFFEEIGYEASSDDVLPGLISFRFIKKMT